MNRHLCSFIYVAICLILFLASCTSPQAEDSIALESTATPNLPTALPTSTTPAQTITPSPLPAQTATPLPEPTAVQPTDAETEKQRLVICMAEPPIPLNPYVNVSMSHTVLQAANDGPVDYIEFTYQPVLLDHIPMAETGEVTLQEITVQSGDLIFNPQINTIQEHTGPEIMANQMVVQFSLRQDVTWSDGEPLTIHDSVYAYQLLSESASVGEATPQSPTQRLIQQTASYDALDEFTAEWKGIPGFISNQYPRFFFPPMPQHLNTDLETNWPTVGWGAFAIEEWIPGQSLLMTRNPNYYRADDGLSVINEIEFRFLEPPYNDLPTEISSDNCHIISLSIAAATPPQSWLEASQSNDFHLLSMPGISGWQLLFNMDENHPTSDPNIRRAISMCLDRSALAEQFYSTAANSYVHPHDPAYTDVNLPEFNPEEGRSLLAESDGEGESLKLVLRAGSSGQILGDQITADLAECGISVETEYLEPETFFQPWPDGPIYNGQYDMTVFALSAAEGPACNWYLSENVPAVERPEGLNISRFQLPMFDQLCNEALITLEAAEYIRLHQETQQVWSEALPALPLFWAMQYTGADCHVDGFEIDPSGLELWNIEEINLSGGC